MKLKIGHFLIVLAVSMVKVHAGDFSPELIKDSSAIVGTLTAKPECEKDNIHVWISQGTNLFYHVSVPAFGTFEFHTIPGKYNVVATSSSGCFSEVTVDTKVNQFHNLTLQLKTTAQLKAEMSK